MYIKFDIKNEKLEWYKKRSVFAKCVIQNNSNALANALAMHSNAHMK